VNTTRRIVAGKWVIWLTMALTWGVSALVVWWLWLQPPPLTVHWIKAVSPEVAPGGELAVRFDSTKTRSCPVTSQYVLIDAYGEIRTLGGLAGWNKVGEGEFVYRIPIPPSMPPGPATFHEVVTYSCNPLRDHIVTTPYVPFTVVPVNNG